jgi:hypothetical protein
MIHWFGEEGMRRGDCLGRADQDSTVRPFAGVRRPPPSRARALFGADDRVGETQEPDTKQGEHRWLGNAEPFAEPHVTSGGRIAKHDTSTGSVRVGIAEDSTEIPERMTGSIT